MNSLRLRFFLMAVSLCGASQAHAATIIYSGMQDIPIPTTFDGVYLDVDAGATSTSVFSGWDINPFFGGVGIANSAAFQPVRIGTGQFDAYKNLTLGTIIDAGTLAYSNGEGGSDTVHFGNGANQFHAGVDGYLGFQFLTNSAAGPYFGWMRLRLTNNTDGALIRDWAYDNSGAGIPAGVAPEPGCAVLLLVGLTVMGLRRTCRGSTDT